MRDAIGLYQRGGYASLIRPQTACRANQARLGQIGVQSSRKKYSASRFAKISIIDSDVPPQQEGRIAIVTDVERGMRWTRQRRRARGDRRAIFRERSRRAQTNGAAADGEVVWSWHPLLVSSLAEAISAQPDVGCAFNPRGDGGKKELVTEESAKETVKTIAQGKPV